MLNGTTFVPWNGSANFTISGGTASLARIQLGTVTAGTDNITLSGSGNLYVGAGGIVYSVGAAAINLNGGTLGALANWTSLVPMGVGGAVTIDTAGNSIGLSGALTGAGSLTKVNGGLLTLGSANNYSGGTTVSSGTLQLGNASAWARAA